MILNNQEALRPLLCAVDKQRKKIYSKFIQVKTLSFIFGIVFWACVALLFYGAISDKVQFCFIAFVSLFIFMSLQVMANTSLNTICTNGKKLLRKSVYPTLISSLDGFSYVDLNSQDTLNLFDKLVETNVLGSITRIVCDDCIRFDRKDTQFSIYDMAADTVVCSGRSSGRKVIFDGILVIAKCHKSFNGITVIKPKKLPDIIQDSLTVFERVKLEDPVFEKNFNVYSTNQIESRFLITTAFMQRLIKTEQKFKGNISCHFENGEIFICINDSKDRFEIPMDKSLVDEKTLLPVFEDLNEILELVNTLKLENNTGL